MNEMFLDFMREEYNSIKAMDDGNAKDARLKNFAKYWKLLQTGEIAGDKLDFERAKLEYEKAKYETEKLWTERKLNLEEAKFAYQKEKDTVDHDFAVNKLKADTFSSRFESFSKIVVGLGTIGAAALNLLGTRDTNASRLKQTQIVTKTENDGNIISGQSTRFLEK